MDQNGHFSTNYPPYLVHVVLDDLLYRRRVFVKRSRFLPAFFLAFPGKLRQNSGYRMDKRFGIAVKFLYQILLEFLLKKYFVDFHCLMINCAFISQEL